MKFKFLSKTLDAMIN